MNINVLVMFRSQSMAACLAKPHSNNSKHGGGGWLLGLICDKTTYSHWVCVDRSTLGWGLTKLGHPVRQSSQAQYGLTESLKENTKYHNSDKPPEQRTKKVTYPKQLWIKVRDDYL